MDYKVVDGDILGVDDTPDPCPELDEYYRVVMQRIRDLELMEKSAYREMKCLEAQLERADTYWRTVTAEIRNLKHALQAAGFNITDEAPHN
jgi:hypothetical protein